MTYYSQHNAYPVTADQLPDQAVGEDGKIWTHLEGNPVGLAACGFVEVGIPPTFDPAVNKLTWSGTAWELLDADPPPVVVPPIVSISHKDFLDLLTFDERKRMTAVQKKIAEQTEAEFLAEGNELYQYAADMFNLFDKSAAIELSNPTTQFGVMNVMLPLEIFDGADTAAQTVRANALLSNTKPS